MLTKLKDELDKAYIDSKLEKMGLVDFEFDVRSICFALFDDKEITNSQVLFLNESLSFGIYGSGELPVPNFIMMNIGQSTVMFPFLNITGLKFFRQRHI